MIQIRLLGADETKEEDDGEKEEEGEGGAHLISFINISYNITFA